MIGLPLASQVVLCSNSYSSANHYTCLYLCSFVVFTVIVFTVIAHVLCINWFYIKCNNILRKYTQQSFLDTSHFKSA